MYYRILLATVLLSSKWAFSQQSNQSPTIYTTVDIPASIDSKVWRAYLMNNLPQRNEEALRKGIKPGQYTVSVRFVVSIDSSVRSVTASEDIGYGLSQKAEELLRNGPKWNPAKVDGHAVTSYHNQSITFLVSQEDFDDYHAHQPTQTNNQIKKTEQNSKPTVKTSYAVRLVRKMSNNGWRNLTYFSSISFREMSDSSFVIVGYDFLDDLLNGEATILNLEGSRHARLEIDKLLEETKDGDLTIKTYEGHLWFNTVEHDEWPVYAKISFFWKGSGELQNVNVICKSSGVVYALIF